MAIIITAAETGISENAPGTSTADTIGSLLPTLRHRQHNETAPNHVTTGKANSLQKNARTMRNCGGRCRLGALMSVKPTAICPRERRVSSVDVSKSPISSDALMERLKDADYSKQAPKKDRQVVYQRDCTDKSQTPIT